jgi:endonuclease/exonuclease/phosphatase (EEP) superfamily protein YafD
MFNVLIAGLRFSLNGLLIILTLFSIGIPFWRIYPFELLSNGAVYYFWGAGLLVLAFLSLRWRGVRVKNPLLLALALFAFNSVWILPWYLPHGQPGSGEKIRVLTFNINTQNDHWDAIAEAISKIQPDVATIIETKPLAQTELARRLAERLPFNYRTAGGGITIFSRFPLIAPQSQTFKHGTVLVTSLQMKQSVVELIAAHPIVPIKPGLFQRRNGLLSDITTYMREKRPKSLILLGDFNLTLWSPYYTRLVKNTGLQNTRSGFGIEPSWIEPASHVHYPRWITALVKIPIDHIFVTQNFKVADCRTRKAANSDHRLLWSDLVL